METEQQQTPGQADPQTSTDSTPVAAPVATPTTVPAVTAAPTEVAPVTPTVAAPAPSAPAEPATPVAPAAPIAAVVPSGPQNLQVYQEVARALIASQENIIGPIALERAGHVSGLAVDWSAKQVTFSGDPKEIIDNLVAQYESLFGQISVEVCREAASQYLNSIPAEQHPDSLKN